MKFNYKKERINLKTKTCYFAAGWFSDAQNRAYKEAYKALEENLTIDFENSYVPLEHQYKDIRVDLHPEYLRDKEWSTATFKGDLVGISASDVCLAVYLPSAEDIGLGTEISFAHSLGKYVLLVIPDEEYGQPINLMSWGFADNVIKLSELKDFDFNKPTFNFYDGSVY